MSVASRSELTRRQAHVLRALIEEARRRARRRRVAIIVVVATVAALLLFVARDNPVTGSAQAASTTLIKTKWSERVDFTYANGGGSGFLRLYVRSIEVTRTRWKAAVGVTNSSAIAVRFANGVDRPDATLPFTYYAGPGIWWSQYVSGGAGVPGSGSVITHSKPATLVRPGFPSRLTARKSWFGTFSGSLAKVPKDRLLRIGFGLFLDPGNFECTGMGTGCTNRKVPLSTTHQFRLPRRR